MRFAQLMLKQAESISSLALIREDLPPEHYQSALNNFLQREQTILKLMQQKGLADQHPYADELESTRKNYFTAKKLFEAKMLAKDSQISMADVKHPSLAPLVRMPDVGTDVNALGQMGEQLSPEEAAKSEIDTAMGETPANGGGPMGGQPVPAQPGGPQVAGTPTEQPPVPGSPAAMPNMAPSKPLDQVFKAANMVPPAAKPPAAKPPATPEQAYMAATQKKRLTDVAASVKTQAQQTGKVAMRMQKIAAAVYNKYPEPKTVEQKVQPINEEPIKAPANKAYKDNAINPIGKQEVGQFTELNTTPVTKTEPERRTYRGDLNDPDYAIDRAINVVGKELRKGAAMAFVRTVIGSPVEAAWRSAYPFLKAATQNSNITELTETDSPLERAGITDRLGNMLNIQGKK